MEQNHTKRAWKRMSPLFVTYSFISEKQRAMHSDVSDVGSVIDRALLADIYSKAKKKKMLNKRIRFFEPCFFLSIHFIHSNIQLVCLHVNFHQFAQHASLHVFHHLHKRVTLASHLIPLVLFTFFFFICSAL